MNIKNLLFKPIIMMCFLSVTGVVLAKDGSRADHSEHKSRANHSEHKSRTDHSKHSSKTDHFSVKFAGTKIVAIDFIRGKDGKHTHRAFPHGYEMVRFATTTKNYTPRQFKSLMKQRLAAIKEHKAPKTVAVAGRSAPTISSSATVIAPAAATATADCTTNSPTGTSTCTTGMAAGFNTSTGYVANTSTCYNYTTTGSQQLSSENLASDSSLSSISQMLSVNASINAAYGLFSGSEDFSFSDSSSTATNSGQIFMNAGSIYSLTNTLDTTTPLTAYGQQALNSSTGFDTACGNSFITSVTAGFVATAQITWSSSSNDTSSSISSTTEGCYATNCARIAVNSANSTSTVQTNFDVTYTAFGGGDAATTAWFMGANDSSGVLVPGVSVAPTTTDQNNCFATPTPTNSAAITTACNSFGADLQAAAANALTVFNDNNTPSPSTQALTNLGDFSVFPNGVKGLALSGPYYADSLLSDFNIPSISGISDLFQPYKNQIVNYLNLINQLSTLQQRSSMLNTALVNNPDYDNNQINLAGLLGSLQTWYGEDYQALVTNLNTCLQSTSSTVASNCGSSSPLGALYAVWDQATAFDFYNYNTTFSVLSGNAADLLLAQNNTIALQYTGNIAIGTTPETNVPTAAVWYLGLPPSNPTMTGYTSPNASNALFLFAYQPWTYGSTTETNSAMLWIPQPMDVQMSQLGLGLNYGWTSPFGYLTPADSQPDLYNTFFPSNDLTILDGCTTLIYTYYMQPCSMSIGTNGDQGRGGSLNPILNFFPLMTI